jgi:hypothetical protein
MDAPCWLLYHRPIVSVNSIQRVDRPGESQEAMDGKKKVRFCLGLAFEPVFLHYALNYACFAHNNLAVVQDSKRSPREIALGERVKTDSFALFGSKVLAEIPDSLRASNIQVCHVLFQLHFCTCNSTLWGVLLLP